MDFGPALHRQDLRRSTLDVLGTGAVYSQPGQLRTVSGQTFMPTDGVRCVDFWPDRCRVDLFGLGSGTGAELRLQLVCFNSDTPTSPVLLLDRGITLAAGSKGAPLSLSLGVASGWPSQYWILLARTTVPGETAEFQARYILDHGNSLYTANGTGTIP